MKLPSCTTMVVTAALVVFVVFSYKFYMNMSGEHQKALKHATSHLDAYDEDRKKALAEDNKAAEKTMEDAKKARELLNKKKAISKGGLRGPKK